MDTKFVFNPLIMSNEPSVKFWREIFFFRSFWGPLFKTMTGILWIHGICRFRRMYRERSLKIKQVLFLQTRCDHMRCVKLWIATRRNKRMIERCHSSLFRMGTHIEDRIYVCERRTTYFGASLTEYKARLLFHHLWKNIIFRSKEEDRKC